jgi:dihydropteroate synthase
MRPFFTWNLGARRLELGPRTLVMGILNVTPDSFSDGGLFFEPGAAIDHGLRLLDEGADILDIGGESTRPGALAGVGSPERTAVARTGVTNQPAVSAEEELRRVIPVIEGIERQRPDAIVSIDTYKAKVAREAVAHGAEIVNDISGLDWDPDMRRTVAELNCGAVLMHTRGRPQEWRTLPPLDDVVGTVKRELTAIAERATRSGVTKDRIVLDPGFGFGKILEQNHPMLARFAEFHDLGFPVLAGVSRKAFIQKLTGDSERTRLVSGSLAAAVICARAGAHVVRVHDVSDTLQALAVADAVVST